METLSKILSFCLNCLILLDWFPDPRGLQTHGHWLRFLSAAGTKNSSLKVTLASWLYVINRKKRRRRTSHLNLRFPYKAVYKEYSILLFGEFISLCTCRAFWNTANQLGVLEKPSLSFNEVLPVCFLLYATYVLNDDTQYGCFLCAWFSLYTWQTGFRHFFCPC